MHFPSPSLILNTFSCSLKQLFSDNQDHTYCFFSLSLNASRAWKIARLLIYCTSPFLNSVLSENRSPKKCNVSRASACASLIGGIPALRGRAPNPTKYRREYCSATRSGAEAVAGIRKRRGRFSNCLPDFSNLQRRDREGSCQATLPTQIKVGKETYTSTSHGWDSVWIRSGRVAAISL